MSARPVAEEEGLPVDFQGLRALVIGADGAHRESREKTLRAWGLAYESAESLTPALGRMAAAACELPFHLVLLDQDRAATDGADLARFVRANPTLRELPLGVLTLANPDDSREASIGAIAEVWLRHPERHAGLRNAVASLIRSVSAPPTPREPFPISTGQTLRRRASCTVLLAEDKQLNRELARDILTALGFQADLAENGRQAVDAFRTRTYDLVLMDCEMPEMDGYEATRTLRRIEAEEGRPRTPVLALTGHALEEDRRRGLAAGMDEYLLKPFKIQQLREMLDRWLPGEQEVQLPAAAPVDADPWADAKITSGSTLDEEALENLRELERQGATGALQRTLQFYLEDAPPLLAQIHTEATRGDADEVRRAAHALKSLSANVGAQALAALCQELEDLGRSGALDGSTNLLATLAAEGERSVAAVRSLVQKEHP